MAARGYGRRRPFAATDHDAVARAEFLRIQRDTALMPLPPPPPPLPLPVALDRAPRTRTPASSTHDENLHPIARTPPSPKEAVRPATPAAAVMPSPVATSNENAPLHTTKALPRTPTPAAQTTVPLPRSHIPPESDNTVVSRRLSQRLDRLSLTPPLQQLLSLCAQSQGLATYAPMPFDNVLFPCAETTDAVTVTKVGEASYSEVFMVSARGAASQKPPSSMGTVLKIMPFQMHAAPRQGHPSAKMSRVSRRASRHLPTPVPADTDEDAPRPVADLVPELAVSLRLARLPGFVCTARVDVVHAAYPAQLLEAWDAYAVENPDEALNTRPSAETPAWYCIAHMPHAGTPLEHFRFARAADVRACLVQLAASLAAAEHACEFEHRDLHWGNVLVRPAPHADADSDAVVCTIIDFTLSRCTEDGSSRTVRWVALPDDVMHGQGDPQFDVYRAMRDVTRGDWQGYYPKTNVLWLQYIAAKLVGKTRSKRLQQALRDACKRMDACASALDAVHVIEATLPHV